MSDPILVPGLKSPEQRAHAQALLTTVYKNYPGRNGLTSERALAIASMPDRLERDVATAEQMYGGDWGRVKLGNRDPGAGYRYRGCGYTQLTGRDNCATMGQKIGEDLIGHPERAAEPDVASRIAVAFWKTHVEGFSARNNMSDAPGSVLKAGALLNGSFDRHTGQVNKANGYPDRLPNARAWEAALKPEHLQALNQGEPVQLATRPRSPRPPSTPPGAGSTPWPSSPCNRAWVASTRTRPRCSTCAPVSPCRRTINAPRVARCVLSTSAKTATGAAVRQ